MGKFEERFEKMRPFFDKIVSNQYLSAVRDGFIACIPIILFSSIFLLFAYLPNAWGFYWSADVTNKILIAYNYSMGLLALFVTGTTSKNLTDSKNLKLKKTNQINPISVIVASEIAFIILAIIPLKSGADITFLGTQGLIAAYIVGLIVPNIYYVCIKNNITIKLPPQVPQNIAQTFKDVLPLGASIGLFWIFDIAFRAITGGKNLPQWIIAALSPLFKASESYFGLCLIAGAMAFFWFLGVHGPSIVQPAVVAIQTAYTAQNLQLATQGEHAYHVLTLNAMDYVMNFGGTGSTFVLAFLFLIFAKSDQLKAIGKASFIPSSFSVNEPILFGTPTIMNPLLMIPFILTPMVNISLLKFFVTTLGMNGLMYTLPWTIPAPIGIVISSGLAPLSFLLVAVILIADTVIYLPFVKAYDKQLLHEEIENAQKLEEEGKLDPDDVDIPADLALEGIDVVHVGATPQVEVSEITNDEPSNTDVPTIDKETNVLVLCAGGGTSGILANALNKIAEERNLPLSAAARAYGQDMDLIKDMDMVILAPQMESMKDKLKEITDKYGVDLVPTSGRQYIELTQNPDKAIAFVVEHTKDLNR